MWLLLFRKIEAPATQGRVNWQQGLRGSALREGFPLTRGVDGLLKGASGRNLITKEPGCCRAADEEAARLLCSRTRIRRECRATRRASMLFHFS